MSPEQQAHYEHCLSLGTSSTLAEMFALGQAPMSNTDREFLSGLAGHQFEKTPHLGDEYAREAIAQGVDIKGAVYLSGLASYPGDPRAWIRGRGDVQRLVEERGWNCEGAVNVKAPPPLEPPTPGPRVAEDIVQREMAEVLAQVPEPERVDLEDLREQVIETRAPHWSK